MTSHPGLLMSLVELTDGRVDTLPGAAVSDLDPIWITASEVHLNGVWNDLTCERPECGATFQAGHPVDAYWPIAPIGGGSHGEIWKAVRVAPSLKLVALKILRRDQAHRADRRDRFRREAEIAMRLAGPAILPVEEFGEADGVLYLVMPLVEGATLAGVIAERQQWLDPIGSTAPTPHRSGSWWTELSHDDYMMAIVRALARIARALALTHSQRVIHRDVKPANILLDGVDEERIFLSDFGLGCHLDETPPLSGDGSGTPLYMAPEKLLGRAVDEIRCDIYGLGATLFEAVTLVRPLAVPEGLHRSCLPTYLAGIEPPRPGSLRPGFPPVLEAIIEKAMHRDPGLRHHSASALADDLEGCLEFLGVPPNDSVETSWSVGSRWFRGDGGQPWGNPHTRQVRIPRLPRIRSHSAGRFSVVRGGRCELYFAMSPDRASAPTRHGLPADADPALLRRRVRVALGQEAGDLLVAGGQVVNVFTRRIEPADIVIADGWIAGVGPGPWRADRTVTAAGQVVLPGLIDTHMHLESTLLTPAELARLVVPMGTTAVISDSHEIGNVLGLRGIDMLIAASAGLPLDLFFMASSCVPATHWEDAGAVFGPRQIRELLARPRVLGLAEVMDIPAVLGGAPEVFEKISAALVHGSVVDGHAPGLMSRELIAYVAAGIRSDHESTTAEEALAKAALGMLVQVRDGSSAQNLNALLPLLASGAIDDAWCLVTDDIFPNDLLREGHIDGMLRRLVAGGLAPAVAVRHAAFVPARHFGLRDRGAVAPGYRADLAIVADVRDFLVQTVIKNGRVAAADGRCLDGGQAPVLNHENTVHLPPLAESAFRLPLASESCPVIEIIPDQIVTRRSRRTVARADGAWRFDPGHDVVLVACIERHRATGRLGLGLVGGFGLTSPGALGSSVAHDSHNLIVAGTNPGDMLVATRALAMHGGGFVVVSEGTVRAILPLPVAGLLSLESADVVCRQLAEVNHAARALGCPLQAPFGTLSFLALPVIPALRITTKGLFDVNEQRFLTL